ncbi:ABC transporter related protein [Desulfonatronospira thiodismutans ASO3-1]|uniref:ABC transporter related protein n=1 Tax=Desulfonatronospira thiodismutans ASO3-1 TaxID=555779 RepID=D6SL73_9BACT|nr:ABC transporter ATP-binding protein [Desulfonatronospira thiodismutans]EFI35434.1 ABC transporter related protein [Desulfonatronospira thiodismutans ASO3-1]
MNAVKISGVSFSRAGQHILQDISMEAGEGEFLAIIGPNGAGKTTLLRLAAGLEQPDSGCVQMLGRAVSSYTRREFAAQVALVPQEVPLEMPFKVAETVLLGRSPHLGLWEMEGEKDRQLALQAMQNMGVEHLAGRRLDQLSGGERQRVFIARAICQQPRVLLLDEPTASLDPAHQVGIMDLLEGLCREQGVSVIMVSHELNLAAMYADRMLLLSRGRTAGTGAPHEVLTRELLEKSYGCRIMVDENPLGKVPRMMPVPEKYGK